VPDESLVVFDLIPPRQYLGANAYRKDWTDFLAIFSGPRNSTSRISASPWATSASVTASSASGAQIRKVSRSI
jgi:hypothetical protein